MKDTEFIIHPECSCTTPMLYDVANGSFDNQKVSILSTEGMLNHVHKSNAKNFVVATETGILYRMRKDNPGKTFIPASEKAECQYMKMITLEKVYDTLVNEKNVVTVPKEIADKARLAIDRMLAIS
jgi:quinolinate synthase